MLTLFFPWRATFRASLYVTSDHTCRVSILTYLFFFPRRSSRLLLCASAAASARKRHGRRCSRYRTRCLRNNRAEGRARMGRSSSGRRRRRSSQTRKRPRAHSSRPSQVWGCTRWNCGMTGTAPSALDPPFARRFLSVIALFWAFFCTPLPLNGVGKIEVCCAREVGVVSVRSRLIAN